MKVVINRCYGGFELSDAALSFMGLVNPGDYRQLGETEKEIRTSPALVKCVETLGDKASGHCAWLRVVEIPDDVEWEISEYDGLEVIEEEHRIWC